MTATVEPMVAALQALIGEEVSAELASLYINRAKATIMLRRRPFAEYDATLWESRYDQLAVKLADFMWKKRGAEGQIRHNENGIEREWQRGDVPWDMLSDVKPLAGVPR